MPIIVVTGKEIEKIKGDYESYLSGLNMVGKIDYSQYSQLYDEGTKHIQRAYELGKSELEKENAELKEIIDNDVDKKIYVQLAKKAELADVQKDQLIKAKEYIKLLLMNCVDVYESTGKTIAEIQAEAEQFLKEE